MCDETPALNEFEWSPSHLKFWKQGVANPTHVMDERRDHKLSLNCFVTMKIAFAVGDTFVCRWPLYPCFALFSVKMPRWHATLPGFKNLSQFHS